MKPRPNSRDIPTNHTVIGVQRIKTTTTTPCIMPQILRKATIGKINYIHRVQKEKYPHWINVIDVGNPKRCDFDNAHQYSRANQEDLVTTSADLAV